MQSKHIHQTILVQTMLIAGLPRAAIVHHLGISLRQIEHIANTMREFEAPEENAPRKQVRVRKSSSIIKSRAASFEASIVIPIYCRLAGERHRDMIDLDSLLSAYSIYVDLRTDLDLSSDQKLTLADVWSLVRDLSREEAMLVSCPRCDTVAYVAIDQVIHSQCPVCPVKEQSSKYLLGA